MLLSIGSAMLHANNPLKDVSSEFQLLYMKAEPLHFIQAATRVVFSTIYGNFAYIVASFSCTFSHLIAKGHVKRCLLRGHDRFTSCYLSLTFPSVYFRTVEIDKSVSGEGAWSLRPHSGCATARGHQRDRNDHVVSLRSCSKNSVNVINVVV